MINLRVEFSTGFKHVILLQYVGDGLHTVVSCDAILFDRWLLTFSISFLLPYSRSRDNSVGIATGYGLDD
jgi:hypothetical protein